MGLAFQFIYLLFYSYLHSPPICNDLFGEFGITSASSIDPVRPDHAFFFFFGTIVYPSVPGTYQEIDQ